MNLKHQGKTIIGISPLILDVSNQAEGYVMAKI